MLRRSSFLLPLPQGERANERLAAHWVTIISAVLLSSRLLRGWRCRRFARGFDARARRSLQRLQHSRTIGRAQAGARVPTGAGLVIDVVARGDVVKGAWIVVEG